MKDPIPSNDVVAEMRSAIGVWWRRAHAFGLVSHPKLEKNFVHSPRPKTKISSPKPTKNTKNVKK